MRLSPVVVPFISVALVCSSLSAAQVTKAPGKYAIIIDSHLAQPHAGGFGRGTSKALYVLNESLRNNLESLTYMHRQPKKVKPYDAVIIVTPLGDSGVPQDNSSSTGYVTLSYVIQKCNAPDQRGQLTYDLGLGSLAGLRELLKSAAATTTPSGASAGAR